MKKKKSFAEGREKERIFSLYEREIQRTLVEKQGKRGKRCTFVCNKKRVHWLYIGKRERSLKKRMEREVCF